MNIISSLLSKKEDSIDLDYKEFENMINQKNVVVLDVRTKPENLQQRIPNSVLIDIHQPDFVMEIDKLDRSKTYMVYCRSGVRSKNACKLMKQMGFENVFNLKNGIISWHGNTEQG
jgi:rhodanese-related sulfurtransferase